MGLFNDGVFRLRRTRLSRLSCGRNAAIDSRVLVGLSVLALIGVGLWLMQPDATPVRDVVVAKQENAVVQETPSVPEGWVTQGGVARPGTDVVSVKDESREPSLIENPPKVPHGFSPAVEPDTNANTKAVFAALKDRSKPSRFSSFVPSEPFDAKAYAENPQAYLDTVEPARVFSPAEPAEGVNPIRAADKRYFRVVQGESVRLAVIAEPKSAVTFTSQSLGFFDNQLTSQTVQADDKGVASANFTAGGGTIDLVQILAAGPVNSGQVMFSVNVSLPAR